MWAKEDNSAKYVNIRKDDLYACTDKLCKSDKSYDLAYLMYKMYKDYYICLPGNLLYGIIIMKTKIDG